MNIVFGIIIGLIILMLLVVAHEFGHFIMARRNGVRVLEFGIGFAPRAIAWVKKPVEQKDEDGKPLLGADGKPITKLKWVKIPKKDWSKPQDSMVFSLNWLPIGGFCAMDGESDADRRKGTFGAASFWGKTKILFGGVAMNWLVAFVILTVLALTGMPQFLEHQFYLGQDAQQIDVSRSVVVDKVVEGSPADEAGFESGDEIIAIEGETVSSAAVISQYGKDHAGETVKYKIKRGEEEKELTANLNPADSEYALGVSMASYGQTFIRSTWSAPIVGLGVTAQITGETFKSLGQLVWNLISGVFRQFSPNDTVREEGREDLAAAGDSVSGPVGIIGVIFPTFASTGISNLAFLAALISVSLACMNVLPIPALDGGRWLIIAIYKLRRKKLTKETEEKIVSRAFMVLLTLIAIITILDIIKLF
jgi:regulator of sigma E protease